MSDKQQRVVIDNITGGRNGYDAPWAIKDDECADAVNVDFYKSRLGNKRGGLSDPALTNGFSSKASTLFRHVPGTDETAAELWGMDGSATPEIRQLAAGTAWSVPTLKDSPSVANGDFSGASINGKLMLAYKSAVGRHHCWDGSTVRRTGLVATVAPTAANTGAGTYANVQRYYRQRSIVQSAGVTIRRSEPSPYVAFTPSGAGTAARVTQAAVINEGETHWEVEVSLDTFSFYRLAIVVIGTTTYDDSAATTSYSSNPLSDLTGKYQLQKAYKFIAADQNRQLGYGSWTATDKQNRIEISGVIGSADMSDEERVDTSQVNSIIDLDENDSGIPTGINGPIFGAFFAFKDRQTWMLTPTGSTSQPYRQEAISKSIGALSHAAIVRAEDKDGNAALYWMSHRGPYRWSIKGLEYIGRNVEDYVLPGGVATINLAATKRVALAVYYADKRQVWFWWATGSSNDPNQGFIFDVQTSGWSRIPTGDLAANVRCAVLFSNTIGASMSRDLKPYIGQTGGSSRVWKADTGTDDNGTAFQSYVITKAVEPGGPGYFGEVGDSELLAKAAAGVTITDTVTADFGVQTTTGTAVLTLTADEAAATRVSRRLEGSGLSGVGFIQHQIGDAAAVSNAWTLDRIVTTPKKHEAAAA